MDTRLRDPCAELETTNILDGRSSPKEDSLRWCHNRFDSNFSLTLHHLYPPYLKVIPQVQNQVCRGQQEESEERLWTPPSRCLKIHFVVPLNRFVQHFPSLATFERLLLNFVDLLRSAQPPEPRGRAATAERNVRSDDYYQ